VTVLTDREVSVGCLAAYGMWSCALTLLSLGWLLDQAHLAPFGIVSAIAGATAMVRQYFVRQNRLMRNAFELGQESTAIPLRQR